MQYRHILAAVDLAEDADFVFEQAQKTATAHDAKLSVVAVLQPIAAASKNLVLPNAARGEKLDEDATMCAMERLSDVVDRLAEGPVGSYVRMGAPAIVIRDLAVELGVDMIVLGSNGRQGLGLLLGSTAFGVLHRVGCDVMLLRTRHQAA